MRNPGVAAEQVLPSKVTHLVLAKGETIRIETPGGAGFGTPDTRSIEALAEDLHDGLVSMEAAQRYYGLEHTMKALKLARQATPS